MRIYYQGPEVVVTSELFIHRGSGPDSFAIRDLRNVCIAPEAADGLGAALVPALAAVAVAALVYAVAGPWAGLGSLVVATFAVTGAAVLRAHRPRRHELRADYRGASVTLFASADARVFHQVSRALRRAIENLPPPSSWQGREAA